MATIVERVNELPLIVITGPTASGKTALAIKLAKEYNGEIVCADSRTVYKVLDIGTAKPTLEEQAMVPHHMLDQVFPDEPYNLARFQRDAQAAIRDIRTRGKVPFLVGGSGLYIDAIVLNYELRAEPDPAQRAAFEAMTLEQLFDYSNKHNINLPNNLYNKRYVIRAIEQGGVNTSRQGFPASDTTAIAIKTESENLKQRIQQRAEKMFALGLLTEASIAVEHYGWEVPPLRGQVYQLCRRLLNNELSQEQAISALAHSDWQLARKQMTWLRRNEWVNWLSLDEAEKVLRSILTRSSAR